jgi:hypothetical protein
VIVERQKPQEWQPEHEPPAKPAAQPTPSEFPKLDSRKSHAITVQQPELIEQETREQQRQDFKRELSGEQTSTTGGNK